MNLGGKNNNDLFKLGICLIKSFSGHIRVSGWFKKSATLISLQVERAENVENLRREKGEAEATGKILKAE